MVQSHPATTTKGFFFFTVQWDIDYYSTLEAHSEFFR